MEDSEPVELKTLRSILGAYAKQVLHWHELDDDEDAEGGVRGYPVTHAQDNPQILFTVPFRQTGQFDAPNRLMLPEPGHEP